MGKLPKGNGKEVGGEGQRVEWWEKRHIWQRLGFRRQRDVVETSSTSRGPRSEIKLSAGRPFFSS